ncbi:hypothetical protein AB0D08_27560 [Kitasatospora sp. NPDC048540]|uniref:hypothetical protein n=1 Tax=Kitasatospora sp. NPDC048540 TaxID=3155634 RepID=UPI0033EA5352
MGGTLNRLDRLAVRPYRIRPDAVGGLPGHGEVVTGGACRRLRVGVRDRRSYGFTDSGLDSLLQAVAGVVDAVCGSGLMEDAGEFGIEVTADGLVLVPKDRIHHVQQARAVLKDQDMRGVVAEAS